MEWNITSYQSVGPLRFGVDRNALRQHFSEQPEVRAVTDAKPPLDVYEDKGLYIVYDKYGTCGAIEIRKPGKAIFQNKDLLQLPYNEALKWFQHIDKDVDETEEQFVSWKYGILFYAPGKNENPDILADTITVFQRDFFYVKNGIPDPAVINSFHIHVAYVEPVEIREREFDNFKTAFQNVFANNKESGFLIWNGIPVPFSYQLDLPVLLEKWVNTIHKISQEDTGELTENFECPSFFAKWEIHWNEKFIKIKSQWEKIEGGFEPALNDAKISELLVLKKDFLVEWKMLFKQSYQTFQTSKFTFSQEKDRLTIKKLKKAENILPGFGKFYKENEKILTTIADGRKKVDFSKMSLFGQGVLVLLVATFIILPVWLMSKDKDSIFWFWENMPQILLYLSPFLLIILYVIIKMFKIRKEMKS